MQILHYDKYPYSVYAEQTKEGYYAKWTDLTGMTTTTSGHVDSSEEDAIAAARQASKFHCYQTYVRKPDKHFEALQDLLNGDSKAFDNLIEEDKAQDRETK